MKLQDMGEVTMAAGTHDVAPRRATIGGLDTRAVSYARPACPAYWTLVTFMVSTIEVVNPRFIKQT